MDQAFHFVVLDQSRGAVGLTLTTPEPGTRLRMRWGMHSFGILGDGSRGGFLLLLLWSVAPTRVLFQEGEVSSLEDAREMTRATTGQTDDRDIPDTHFRIRGFDAGGQR